MGYSNGTATRPGHGRSLFMFGNATRQVCTYMSVLLQSLLCIALYACSMTRALPEGSTPAMLLQPGLARLP
jgi:hypothetical protein